MVQFRPGVDGDPADYWKLSRPRISVPQLRRYLRDNRFYAPGSAKKDRLLTLLSRCQRGLPSYDTCLVKTLKIFCHQRGIVLHKAARRAHIITTLEDADEDLTFNRFLDLPPELRNRIYSMHLESFPVLSLPTTPPITRTSRQLRLETLTLFYQTCKVMITLALRPTPLGLRPRLPQGKPIEFTEFAKLIFSHLPEEYLGSLGRFLVEGVANAFPAGCVDTGWYVDLGSGGNQVYISIGRARAKERYLPGGFEAGRKMVEGVMRVEMEAIMARVGQSKLQPGDLEALCHAEFYFKSSANTNRLTKLLSRQQRGLLSYDACTTEVLKSFCADRQLTTAKSKKEDLVRALEEADEDATFERFFDLPPELRNYIYSLHFESFSLFRRPTPPPIVQTSRQLRQESLTLFYRTCITQIGVSPYVPAKEGIPGGKPLQGTDPLMAFPDTKLLFSRMPEELLGNIRKFELVGMVFGTDFRLSTKWRVNLARGGDRGLLSDGEMMQPAYRHMLARFDAAREKLEERMRVELGAIAARDGEKKLRREDLETFRRMFMIRDSEDGGE